MAMQYQNRSLDMTCYRDCFSLMLTALAAQDTMKADSAADVCAAAKQFDGCQTAKTESDRTYALRISYGSFEAA